MKTLREVCSSSSMLVFGVRWWPKRLAHFIITVHLSLQGLISLPVPLNFSLWFVTKVLPVTISCKPGNTLRLSSRYKLPLSLTAWASSSRVIWRHTLMKLEAGKTSKLGDRERAFAFSGSSSFCHQITIFYLNT